MNLILYDDKVFLNKLEIRIRGLCRKHKIAVEMECYVSAKEMRQLFLKLKEEGKTILLASHNREDIAALCDTTVEIDRGKITKTRT